MERCGFEHGALAHQSVANQFLIMLWVQESSCLGHCRKTLIQGQRVPVKHSGSKINVLMMLQQQQQDYRQHYKTAY